MSAIAESLRRQRMPLLTIAAIVLLGAVAWAAVSRTTADHLSRPDYPVAAPAIEQAEWRIDYAAQGRFGKLTKDQLARYAAQKVKAAALVQGVYDGIFLQAARLQQLIRDSFSADAARSLEAQKFGFPAGATDVKTTRRRARIALDAGTADYAIARVTVLAGGTVGKRTVEVEHRSTLWMERGEGGWKVIAFDLKQAPSR